MLVRSEEEAIQDQPCCRGSSSEEQQKEIVAQVLEKLLECLVGTFFWGRHEGQPAFASVQHGARAGRQDAGRSPVVSGCMAAGDAASWFAISFHTDAVFPAFSSLLLLISGLWGREGRGKKRKGREKKGKKKEKRKETGKGKRKEKREKLLQTQRTLPAQHLIGFLLLY